MVNIDQVLAENTAFTADRTAQDAERRQKRQPRSSQLVNYGVPESEAAEL